MIKISCKKGWQKANSEEKKRIMKKLLKIFNVTTVQSVYAYMRGERVPTTVQADATEKAFMKEGIYDIWDRKIKKTPVRTE